MNEKEMFEKTIVDKCGFNPETSFELSSVTGDYKSDVVYFAWLMWQASAQREGYKLVPVDPTDIEIESIKEKHWSMRGCQLCKSDYIDLYKAMIGATL